MYATNRWCSAVLLALATSWVATAAAPTVAPPAPPPPGTAKVIQGPPQKIPQAPDACGPGWYNKHPCGMIYGPNYCLRPCYLPPNGLLPYPVKPPGAPGPLPPPNVQPPMPGVYNPQQVCPTMVFPTHPYARSPRDYFMLD